jgi:hypothetical protein
MNALKKLFRPGKSLQRTLLNFEKLDKSKMVRMINSLVSNVQVSNSQFETKLNQNNIEISFNSSQISNMRKIFPYTWLRDNCKCPKCYNYLADEIERDLLALDENIRPIHLRQVSTIDQPNQIEIICKNFE